MSTKTLATVADDVIDAYGQTAKNIIQAYRIGGERAIDFADQRWDAAINAGAARLSDELRGNLLETRKRISGYYTKGLHLGTDRAEPAVDTAVDFAHKKKADYVAMATHGRTGLRRLLLGSVAEQVVRHAHVPVVLYPPPA